MYKSNIVSDYFLVVKDSPSMFKFTYRSWLLALPFILEEFNSHTISQLCEILKKTQQNKLTETCKQLCLPNVPLMAKGLLY